VPALPSRNSNRSISLTVIWSLVRSWSLIVFGLSPFFQARDQSYDLEIMLRNDCELDPSNDLRSTVT